MSDLHCVKRGVWRPPCGASVQQPALLPCSRTIATEQESTAGKHTHPLSLISRKIQVVAVLPPFHAPHTITSTASDTHTIVYTSIAVPHR